MENSDYSFMKTGFESLQGLDQHSTPEKAQLLSMIRIYFEEALGIAESYVVYENRTIITANDIVLALKVQALDKNLFWDEPETATRLQTMYTEIYEDLSLPDNVDDGDEDVDVDGDGDDDGDDGDDDGDDEGDDDDVDDAGATRELLENEKMEESTYLLIKSANNRWTNWNPTDELHILLKSAIDNTELKMKVKPTET